MYVCINTIFALRLFLKTLQRFEYLFLLSGALNQSVNVDALWRFFSFFFFSHNEYNRHLLLFIYTNIHYLHRFFARAFLNRVPLIASIRTGARACSLKYSIVAAHNNNYNMI